MADEAEAKIKLVADDGGAVANLEKLASAAKRAAAAEADYQKNLKQRAAIVRDLVRMDAIRPGGVIDRMGGAGVGHGSLALRNDAIHRAGRGYSSAGGGFGDRAVGAVAGRLGMSPGAAAAGGGALAAAGVVRQGLLSYQEQARIDADAWMTERQKNERKARAMPFGVGRAYGAALDFYRDTSGRTAQLNRFTRLHQERSAELPLEARQHAARFTHGFAEQSAAIDARAMRGLSLARPAGHDRGTVMGERLYNEEARLLPLIQQRQVAARKVLAAEDKSLKAASEEAKIRDEIKKHDQDIEHLRGKRKEADQGGRRPGSAANEPKDMTLSGFRRRQGANFSDPVTDRREDASGWAMAEDLLHKRRAEAQARLEAAMGRSAEHNTAAAEARSGLRQADTAVQREQAEILSGREMTARGQAERFGVMGVDGRVRGRFALARLQKVGIDRADSQTIAEAAAYAPDTVRKQAGRSGGAGERELGVGRRLTGDSGEFRDTDLNDISRRAAEAREKAVGLQEKDIKQLTDETARAINGLTQALVAAIQKSMAAAVKELEAQNFVRNNQ